MADCHPILFLRMADRLKAGAKLIVVDPRRTTTADKADLYLQIKPGTDLALLNGLLHLLVENGDIDAANSSPSTPRAGTPCRPSSPTTRRTGSPRSPDLAEADIRTAAAMIAEAGEWMTLLDHGAQPEHPRHLEHQRDLQPAPGHRRDLPARQRADVADRAAQRHGRSRNGLHGAGIARPARRLLAPRTARSSSTQWGLAPGTIRTRRRARHHRRCSSRLAAGEIKACWIICTNPVATVANRRTVIAGLEAAELVITQDAYARHRDQPVRRHRAARRRCGPNPMR